MVERVAEEAPADLEGELIDVLSRASWLASSVPKASTSLISSPAATTASSTSAVCASATAEESMREGLRLYIDGDWVDPLGSGVIDVVNPATRRGVRPRRPWAAQPMSTGR